MNKIIKKDTKKRIKSVYIYRDSKLPYNGWIQSCFNCYIFTERTILFKTYYDEDMKTLYEFNVFLCPLCQRDLIKKKKKENILLNIKFQRKCHDYIYRNYYI
tara:strand:- start:369 stop:674 length:306 start_codon:yes stop_codon:yes gene_type:complete